MKPKHIRLMILLFSMFSLGTAVFLSLFYNKDSLLYYVTPSQINATNTDKKYRIGGLVTSWQHTGISNTFIIADETASLTVFYNGVVPDLFKVGQGAIIDGNFDEKQNFIASRVLAKHDENYSPPKK